MQRPDWTRTAIAVALGLALTAPAAFAQAANPPQQPPGQAAAPADAGAPPTEAELQHFANAAVQVDNIRKSLQPELASAQSADQRTQIKASAEKKMESVVRSNDLTLKRYVQIANAQQANPALRKKIQHLMPPAPQSPQPQSPQPQSPQPQS